VKGEKRNEWVTRRTGLYERERAQKGKGEFARVTGEKETGKTKKEIRRNVDLYKIAERT